MELVIFEIRYVSFFLKCGLLQPYQTNYTNCAEEIGAAIAYLYKTWHCTFLHYHCSPLNTCGYGNHVCLHGELWLHGWPNFGNAQLWLVLAALFCTNGSPTIFCSQRILIQIETQLTCLRNVRPQHCFSIGTY